jgi:multisubunit Na+/H+ antiporter MnhE subunit
LGSAIASLSVRLEHLTRNGVGWFSGDATVKNLLFGFAAGYCLLFRTQRLTGRSKYFGKVSQVIGFVGFYFWELTLANLRVAYDVITPPSGISYRRCDFAGAC